MTEKSANSKKLTEREEWLGAEMIEVSFSIHRTLGPGLLESIYEHCFCHELAKRGITFSKQHPVQIRYKDLVIDNGLRIDLLVEDSLIIELKAQENYHPIWEAQLLTYLKLTGKRLGYILNFDVPLMKNGIKRMIL